MLLNVDAKNDHQLEIKARPFKPQEANEFTFQTPSAPLRELPEQSGHEENSKTLCIFLNSYLKPMYLQWVIMLYTLLHISAYYIYYMYYMYVWICMDM